ncbi:hypothetical protein GCM10012287_13840 [Streptomyces daqingensis]|uniref:Uncharacterized protein n=1 Tax=Streptomyces daqingensis TaxID=1472640 RepID=A0ABQ2M100_9ACTN|nr:hypothetical protein GCM10012287_13840 [Streptomyces daqingensis]
MAAPLAARPRLRPPGAPISGTAGGRHAGTLPDRRTGRGGRRRGSCQARAVNAAGAVPPASFVMAVSVTFLSRSVLTGV